MRRVTRAVAMTAIIAALLAFVVPAGAEDIAAPEAEHAFIAAINTLRAERGLDPYIVDANLTEKARTWATTMAAAGSIWHSQLSEGVTSNWLRLGENVGSGPEVGAIHDALVASPSHLANLTDPGFRFVGVGAVNVNGTMYVSQVFMEQASQPAPSTPAPAAGAPSFADPEPSVAPTATPTEVATGAPDPSLSAPTITIPVPAAAAPADAPEGITRVDVAFARLRALEA